MIRIAAAATLAAALFAPSAAGAQTPSPLDVARSWGLLGRWSLSCGQPVGDANPLVVLSEREGRLIEERDFGARKLLGQVLKLAQRPDGALLMEIAYPSTTRERIEIRYGPQGRRIVSDRDLKTNEVTIRDGRFPNNELTPVEHRCPDAAQ